MLGWADVPRFPQTDWMSMDKAAAFLRDCKRDHLAASGESIWFPEEESDFHWWRSLLVFQMVTFGQAFQEIMGPDGIKKCGVRNDPKYSYHFIVRRMDGVLKCIWPRSGQQKACVCELTPQCE